MYEDEYYYEARKKENAKLDAELAGTFATVIGGLIGAVLSCLIFLLRRFDVLSSGLASLLFYMLTYTREWHVAVYITVAFVIFIFIHNRIPPCLTYNYQMFPFSFSFLTLYAIRFST